MYLMQSCPRGNSKTLGCGEVGKCPASPTATITAYMYALFAPTAVDTSHNLHANCYETISLSSLKLNLEHCVLFPMLISNASWPIPSCTVYKYTSRTGFSKSDWLFLTTGLKHCIPSLYKSSLFNHTCNMSRSHLHTSIGRSHLRVATIFPCAVLLPRTRPHGGGGLLFTNVLVLGSDS